MKVVADIAGWAAWARGQQLSTLIGDPTAAANALHEGVRYFRLDGVLVGWTGGGLEAWAECTRRLVARLGRDRLWGRVDGPVGRIQQGWDPWDAEDSAGEEVEQWAALGAGGIVVREPEAPQDLAARHQPLLRRAAHYGVHVLLAVQHGIPADASPWWAVAVPEGSAPYWRLANHWEPYPGPGLLLCWPEQVTVEEAQLLARRG